MIFESFLPGLALQGYIEAYHLRHFQYADSFVMPFKPYHAQPEQCLSFYIRAPEVLEYVAENRKIVRFRAEISGQYTVRVNRHLTGSDFLILIVNFQPGALYRLTGIPAYELVNTGVDAATVFGKEIRQVNARLNSTDNYSEMIAIVEAFLFTKFSALRIAGNAIDHIGKYIIKSPEKVSLATLARDANLCPRQFERNFIERTGVGPKMYTRLARFNRACKLKYLLPSDDWLSIALSCGYHDYSHLVRDCKEFAGTTPMNYFLQDTGAPERDFESMKPEKYIYV